VLDLRGMATKHKTRLMESDTDQLAISTTLASQSAEESGDIAAANLRALQPIYFAAILEEARGFDVVERLVTMFASGMLPLGPERTGAMLYKYWKGDYRRLTTEQRRTVYARAFGMSGGEAGVTPNREFNDLWMRFVSIVGMYSAELQSIPPEERSVGEDEVLISGRELAINLSTHGDGLPWFAAADFKAEVQQAMELFSSAELQIAFGAKTPWEVIYNVASSELGAAMNVSRAHIRVQSGTIIIRWLANRRARLLRPRSANILKHEEICEERTAASQNKNPTLYPTDFDLVTACEKWLGVTGTQAAELEMQERVEVSSPQQEKQDPVA
jgi:hypothetical protein